MKNVLITGGAGFIGSSLTSRLLAAGESQVTCLDSFDDFYPRARKLINIQPFLHSPSWKLVEADIRDAGLNTKLPGDFDVIVHLAARAGVRPSISDPLTYQDVNVAGTQNLLELARRRNIPQFVFASSSSVYGVNPRVPWKESDGVLEPISPYASTKVSGELLGHVYSRLYGMRFLALRFFTVYGPRQRPDLAIHKFSHLMTAGYPIPFYGDGSTRRDYTFVDDITSGIAAAMNYTSSGYEVFNLGNDRTVTLKELVSGLEEALGVRAAIDWQPEQPGDVPQTWADISKAKRMLGYNPATTLQSGLARFADWYLNSARDLTVNTAKSVPARAE
ncbi:MAG: GDP-mannose 4,6-dehydratase [Bryobacteraceae bacterium]|nr:GDP-mannose 4,6-dehydratase [Bryobacteraceae bacterium]